MLRIELPEVCQDRFLHFTSTAQFLTAVHSEREIDEGHAAMWPDGRVQRGLYGSRAEGQSSWGNLRGGVRALPGYQCMGSTGTSPCATHP